MKTQFLILRNPKYHLIILILFKILSSSKMNLVYLYTSKSVHHKCLMFDVHNYLQNVNSFHSTHNTLFKHLTLLTHSCSLNSKIKLWYHILSAQSKIYEKQALVHTFAIIFTCVYLHKQTYIHTYVYTHIYTHTSFSQSKVCYKIKTKLPKNLCSRLPLNSLYFYSIKE